MQQRSQTQLEGENSVGVFISMREEGWIQDLQCCWCSDSRSIWTQTQRSIHRVIACAILKPSARVSSGFQREKTFETTRPQAEWFLCFQAFGNLMKPEARVFEITSLKKQFKTMQCHVFPICVVCELLYSVGIHFTCELLFLINQ